MNKQAADGALAPAQDSAASAVDDAEPSASAPAVPSVARAAGTTPVAPAAQAESRSAPPEEEAGPDSLMLSVSWMCHHHGRDASIDALVAGLPRGAALSPSLAIRALERVGLSAGLIERTVDAVSSYLFPIIVLRRDGGACILVDRKPVKGAGKKSGALEYHLVLPEQGPGVTVLSQEDADALCLPLVLLVKPLPRIDTRAGDNLPRPRGHWLLSTVWHYRRYYYSAALGALLLNVLALSSTFFTMNVYDRVVPNQAFVTLWSLAIGVTIAIVFEFIARYIRAHLLDVAGKKADLIVGAMLFRQAMSMRMENKPASSGAFANQLREFESVRDFAASATLATLTDLPFTLLFIAVIFMIGGPLALVPTLAIPIIIGVSMLIQWPLSRIMQENLRESSLKQGVLIEAVDGIESLKASRGEGYMQKRWEEYSALTSTSSMKSKTLSSLATNFVTFVQQIETVVIVVWGVYLISAGQLTQGALFGSVILAGRAVAPLAQVVGLAVRFQQAKAALKSLNNLMAAPTERDPAQKCLAAPQIEGDLELRGAGFAYPAPPMQPNPPVLQNISLKIRPGERVAVIGRIGCGKSTLLRLFARLYQPSQGQLLIDGIDATQIDTADWRAAVGFVGQDARLFYGTLRENVMIGRPEASTAEFLHVARLTGIDQFASRHPLGFNLPIGEMGAGLSGGQRQLVALARCLLTHPRVLLLDEPTSAMDTQTEAIFMEQLARSTNGQTLVIVTHRMSLLDLVDRVIVLDEGRVVADGTKEQIIAALTANSQKARAES